MTELIIYAGMFPGMAIARRSSLHAHTVHVMLLLYLHCVVVWRVAEYRYHTLKLAFRKENIQSLTTFLYYFETCDSVVSRSTIPDCSE